MASAIPSVLRAQVEHDTGCVIAAERARGGGGASRQGAELTLRASDGETQRCYLAWDGRAGEASRMPFFERETAILKALSGPFAASGVKVAPIVASFPSHLALLSKFVAGDDKFALAGNKSALAADFIGQLAALHTLDASDTAFAKLGDASTAPSRQIRENIAQWQRTNLEAGADPVLQVALAWAARNVPLDSGPAVVLHGDAGPGNFLFNGSEVAALVDWELTHLGDPMEDLAQIWVRSLIQPFVPMAEVFAAYERAGGTKVDLAKVKFHRLYFQLSFTVSGAMLAAATGSQVGASGTGLLYGTMHKRVMVRAVAEMAQIVLVDPVIPEVDPHPTDRYFVTALNDLKDDIVPAASNQRASAKAKDLARLVKFWRRQASHGGMFDAAELAEIKALLPTATACLTAARAALAEAIAADAIDFAAALQLCHNRVMRETFIMAGAMGTLATTWYEDLD